MKIPATALELLGRSSLVASAAALIGIPMGLYPHHRSLASYLFVVAMLVAISAGVLVAARLQRQQDPLAEKAVPSTLAAYLLFLLMTLRWLAP